MKINKYNPAEQTTEHLASMNGKDITYAQFCQSLAKSGDVMDKEISEDEHNFWRKSQEFYLQVSMELLKLPDFFFHGTRANTLAIEHMVIGMCGECGEILDLVKNLVIYRKDISFIDKEGKRLDNNFVEEIGDFMFYKTEFIRLLRENLPFAKISDRDKKTSFDVISILDDLFNTKLEAVILNWNQLYKGKIRPVTLQMCVEENINKLAKRYAKGSYSDAQAVARADKNENDFPNKEDN